MPQVFKTAGYVREQDVQHTAITESELTNLDANTLQNNDLVWIGSTSNLDSKNVKFTITNLMFVLILDSVNQLSFTLSIQGGIV